jgi:ribosome biogenesis protein MAK21
MQPAGSAIEGIKLHKGEVPDEVQVNQPAFWKKKESQVPVDQMFFYSYFRQKEELMKRLKKKQENGDEAETDEEEEEEEGEENKEVEEVAKVEIDADKDEETSNLEEAKIWKMHLISSSFPTLLFFLLNHPRL